MTDEEYLNEVVTAHNNEINLEKKRQGKYSISEIIEAMKQICPEAWNDTKH